MKIHNDKLLVCTLGTTILFEELFPVWHHGDTGNHHVPEEASTSRFIESDSSVTTSGTFGSLNAYLPNWGVD
jgi:hypothetical protein